MARSFLLSSALFALRTAAQSASPYTDEKSGITFNGYTHPSTGYRFGLALPETPTTDFIGQIVAPAGPDGGWGGFSMGQSMSGNLLVVAWQNDGEIVSSFRKATGYTSPPVTAVDATLSTIPDGTYANDTAFSYTFLCSGCISDGGLVLSDTSNVLGWAFSDDAITDPTSASSALTYHTAGFGAFGLSVADAKSADFETWAALAQSGSGGNSTTPGGNSTSPIGGGGGGGGGGSSNGTTGGNTTATISNSTYDYIVSGAGAAGIVVAQRLAESGASVLLLERGGPSLASSGNNDTLSWNSSMTMYDVPGLDYYLSKVGNVAFCTDTADQAGCLLGGGTSVNAMMFVKPQAKDFDDQWPQGWKWSDIASAADRVYERNPGQNFGSVDGVRYNNEAYDLLSKFFAGNGWADTDFIDGDINARNNVYGHPPWNTADGLRSGVVRTYLPLAQQLSNFELMMNTKVIRAVRNGSAITGVETETSSGARVIYNVNAGGSVILSSGAMSTPRILFNSGIGPTEQLQTVASGTSGVTLPEESEWIDLPVGAEIRDHAIFTLKFNTSAGMYAPDTTEFTSPNQTTVDLFAKGNGVLAQSGQRLNWWTSVNTTDGQEVFFQGTCNGPSNNTIQMKVYITHGATSVGSLGITADGATELTKEPRMNTDVDIEATTLMMDRLLEMTNAPNSTLKFYSTGSFTATNGANVTGADLIKDFVTGAHYVGTAKMGTKGDAGVVVDTDTKVYGTDNLFVVDASMHPDLPTGNTQVIVMVAAEAAAAKILALNGKSANGTAISTALPVGTGLPLPSGTGIAQPQPTQTGALLPTGTGVLAVPPAIPTSPSQSGTPSQPSQPTEPTQTRHIGGNRPWWWGGRGHGGNNNRPTPTTLATQTLTPTPSAAGHQFGSYRRIKRSIGGRLPLSPDSFDDEQAVWERSRMERASYLDTYDF